MRRIILTAALTASSIAAAAQSGGPAAAGQSGEAPSSKPPEAEQSASPSGEDEIGLARDALARLLASERIDRIDFRAETHDQGMDRIHAAVDRIIELVQPGSQDTTVLVDHASQVIEAFDTHEPRGLMLTFGKNAEKIPVRTPAEARMLGELVGHTLCLIREQFGDKGVSYRDQATSLFRSVVLDAEEGPYLAQYLEGIRRIVDLPPARRGRYFR